MPKGKKARMMLVEAEMTSVSCLFSTTYNSQKKYEKNMKKLYFYIDYIELLGIIVIVIDYLIS